MLRRELDPDRIFQPTAAPSARRIDVAAFTSAGMSGAEIEAAYLDHTSHTLSTRFLSKGIFADMRSAYLGAVHIIRAHNSPRRSERTVAAITQDRFGGVSVQLAVSGSAVIATAAGTAHSIPGSVLILDFAQPFVATDEGPREVINLSFPRKILQRQLGDPRDLHGRVLIGPGAELLASHIGALGTRFEHLTLEAGEVAARVALDLTMLALDRQPSIQIAKGDRREAMAARARRLIDARLGSADLTPERLMAYLNVSRSDLYSLFEGEGGVARYIWRRRVEVARAALLDPSDKRRISEIAFACGFSSEAHFSRTFRKAFDQTPSAARRTAE